MLMKQNNEMIKEEKFEYTFFFTDLKICFFNLLSVLQLIIEY